MSKKIVLINSLIFVMCMLLFASCASIGGASRKTDLTAYTLVLGEAETYIENGDVKRGAVTMLAIMNAMENEGDLNSSSVHFYINVARKLVDVCSTNSYTERLPEVVEKARAAFNKFGIEDPEAYIDIEFTYGLHAPSNSETISTFVNLISYIEKENIQTPTIQKFLFSSSRLLAHMYGWRQENGLAVEYGLKAVSVAAGAVLEGYEDQICDVNLLLSSIYLDAGDYKNSAKCLDIVAFFLDNVELHNENMARYYYLLSRHALAEERYDDVFSLTTKSLEHWQNVENVEYAVIGRIYSITAQAYENTNNPRLAYVEYSDAEKIFKQIIKQNKDSELVYYQRILEVIHEDLKVVEQGKDRLWPQVFELVQEQRWKERKELYAKYKNLTLDEFVVMTENSENFVAVAREFGFLHAKGGRTLFCVFPKTRGSNTMMILFGYDMYTDTVLYKDINQNEINAEDLPEHAEEAMKYFLYFSDNEL